MSKIGSEVLEEVPQSLLQQGLKHCLPHSQQAIPLQFFSLVLGS